VVHLEKPNKVKPLILYSLQMNLNYVYGQSLHCGYALRQSVVTPKLGCQKTCVTEDECVFEAYAHIMQGTYR